MKRRTGGACTPNIIPTPRPSRRCCQRKRGTPIGVPLGVGVWLPVPGVNLRLGVNDPRVVVVVGRDIDRRGHSDRRVDGRGGLGGGGEGEDGGCDPTSDDGGKSELVHCGAFFCVLSCAVFEPWHEVAVRRLGRPLDDGSFAPIQLTEHTGQSINSGDIFDRWLAETGQRPRPGALHWTPNPRSRGGVCCTER